MQQAKISTFFKPSTKIHGSQLSDEIEACEDSRKMNPNCLVTYKRRASDVNSKSDGDVDDKNKLENGEIGGKNLQLINPSVKSDLVGKIPKKRTYAQYHLELGQSDFLLHTCSVCGLMYAIGDEEDEKVHKEFHKEYYQGIQFKGWRNERVVSAPGSNGDRIVMVLDCDPSARKQKVNRIIKMMEKELGFSEGCLIHKHCKVYLFILSHRAVGCLVAEPIKTAHRVISSSLTYNRNDRNYSNLVLPKLQVADKDLKRPNKTTLQFGGFNFQREIIKKDCSANSSKVNVWDSGAILCEEEALPAICGVRAIWVAPSSRRKRIASQLLDAARKTFSEGHMLETSQCAFSSPTSSGKAFASSYNHSESFLIYRENDV